MNRLFLFSILLVGGTSSYAANITWMNSLAPAFVNDIVDLGTTSRNFLDNTNSFNLLATSLNITDLPLTVAVGGTVSPTYAATGDLGFEDTNNGTEQGLGVMNVPPDAEIRNGYTLQISFPSLTLSALTLTVDSIDSASEGYRIWGSSTANGPMTLLATNNGSAGFLQAVSVNAGYQFYEVTSNTPNNGVSSVILRSVAATTGTTPPPPPGVPEPASVALMGAGLLGVGLMRRLRKSR